MDKAFFIGIGVGLLSRVIMLNIDQKQCPTQPNILLSQFVLAFVASSLGALLTPALGERSYTSITFLSLAAEQFRKVRESRRNVLQNLEDVELVQRGEPYIEEIARTFEVRNYMCILTSFFTTAFYSLLMQELDLSSGVALLISSVSGIALAFALKRMLRRQSIGDIADVKIVDISFVNDSIMQIGELKGVTNVGLESDRQRILNRGIGIEIIPKDNSYLNAGILMDCGQRQAIIYTLYSRLGILREFNEPAFSPLPRRNPNKESLMIAYLPIEKDANKVIEAVKSCPILSSAKGKNLSLKDYKISNNMTK